MKKRSDTNSAKTEGNINFPKGHPFDVPDGYFDNLPDRILEKVKGLPEPIVPRIPIYKRRVFSYAAAVLIILIAISGITIITTRFEKNSNGENTVTISDIYDAYIDQSVDEYTLQSYYINLVNDSLEPMMDESFTGNDTSLTPKAIEAYLLESYDPENILNH